MFGGIRLLTFTISGREITRTDSEKIIADSVNYLSASATFDEEWTSKTITAYFSCGSVRKAVYNIQSGTAFSVPWEVLHPGNLFIYFEGYNGTTRITTAKTRPIRVHASGRVLGALPASPGTKDLYEQVLDNFADAKEKAESVRTEADAGEFNGTSLEYDWSGTSLGVRQAGQTAYEYQELKGNSGVYVGTGTMPSGYNVQIDPSGSSVNPVLAVNGFLPDSTGVLALPAEIAKLVVLDTIPINSTGIQQIDRTFTSGGASFSCRCMGIRFSVPAAAAADITAQFYFGTQTNAPGISITLSGGIATVAQTSACSAFPAYGYWLLLGKTGTALQTSPSGFLQYSASTYAQINRIVLSTSAACFPTGTVITILGG